MPDPYLVGNGRWCSTCAPNDAPGTGPNPDQRRQQAEALRAAARDDGVVARFNAKHLPEPNTGCWLWAGACTQAGYGRIASGKVFFLAHRLSYQISNGDVRAGHLVCHSCDTPSCVNPDHLWLGTPEQNTQDCIGKGRLRPGRLFGESVNSAKLTTAAVLEIVARSSAGDTVADLSQAFGVSKNAIARVLKGETWAHVTGISRRIHFTAEEIVAATIAELRSWRARP